MKVNELVTCVRQGSENARNVISVVQFLINGGYYRPGCGYEFYLRLVDFGISLIWYFTGVYTINRILHIRLWI